jgi:hypothetical protein
VAGVSGGSLPFVVDVQRLESSDVTAASDGETNWAGNAQGAASASIGTLGGTPSAGGANASATSAVTTEPGHANSTSIAVVDAGNAALTGGDPDSADPSSPGDFSGRIAVGPLASREAAPLGPNLANVTADPAPSVDRYERALSQDIDEHSTGTIEESLVRSGRRVDHEVADSGLDEAHMSDETASGDGSYVAIAGLGALPLMVSAPTNGKPSTDLDALLAAMPGVTHAEAGPTVAEYDDLHVDPALATLTAPASSSHADGHPAPDYLTSACVLAVGMGLTAGPLIPDLLRLFPRRPSRRRFVPAGRPVGTTSRRRGFGDWLGRRLV